MSSKLVFGLVTAAVVIGYADPSRAAGPCGPNSYVTSSYRNPSGGISYNCACTSGFVAITTARTPLPNPGCVAARGRRPSVASRPRPATPRTGSYRAEPAREPPRQREPAPALSPRKQEQLGLAAPPEKPAPAAAVVPPHSRDTPVPRLGAQAWSKSFPTEKSPPALQLPRVDFDRLREAKTRSVEWMRDKAQDRSLEFGFEQMPKGDWVNSVRNLGQRMKDYFKDTKESATEYVNKIFEVSNEGIGCLASTRIDCDTASSSKLERSTNEYGSKESKRWKSWLKEDLSP